MKGLIAKEYLFLPNKISTVGKFSLMIFFINFILIAFNLTDVLMLVPFFTYLSVVGPFSIDEKSNWNLYGITLPTLRKGIVVSKYATIIIRELACFVSAVIFYPLFCFILNRSFDMEIFFIIFLTPIFFLYFVSFGFPFLFKMENFMVGNLINTYGGLILAVIPLILLLFIKGTLGVLFVFPIAIFLTVLFLFLSYKISLKWFQQREF